MRNKIFVAIAKDGTPVNGVFSFFSRTAVETTIADRIANGEAFEGERCRSMTINEYNFRLTAHNLNPLYICYKMDVAETIRHNTRRTATLDHLR